MIVRVYGGTARRTAALGLDQRHAFQVIAAPSSHVRASLGPDADAVLVIGGSPGLVLRLWPRRDHAQNEMTVPSTSNLPHPTIARYDCGGGGVA